MGRYVGDGWKKESRTGDGIVICCSERNEHSLIGCIESLGLHYTIAKERTVIKVIICMNELNLFVERYGYYAGGKQVDIETMCLPVELLRGFVNGYLESDGCFTNNEFKASSISRILMYGMQQCISKAYHCPVRMYYTKRSDKTTIEGRVCNQHDSYSIVWHVKPRKQDKAFYEDGYVWFPVQEVTECDKTDLVFNMSVENAQSYTANGCIVHNCQDISSAGLQRGFIEGSGTRSSLLWECKKAIEAKRPKYLLMENVKALTQKKFMPYFKSWIQYLEKQGYKNFWRVLNAKNFGVPQNRERVFMVSIRDDGDNPSYTFPDPFPLTKRLKDILEKEVDESFYLRQEQVRRIVDHCERKAAEGLGFKTDFSEGDASHDKIEVGG
jgi:DNA-cytosine methyltransferase